MLTETILEDEGWAALNLSERAEAAARGALAALDLDPDAFEIAVLGCNDARIATLNADFRGKPQPTNVLSWPEEDLAAEEPGASRNARCRRTPSRISSAISPSPGRHVCARRASSAYPPIITSRI